jgi:arginase family enzyme
MRFSHCMFCIYITTQTLCDIGDVFTIPANIEKTFDQISNAVAHIASNGTMPIILGGDHSIGFPTVRGLASVTSKNIGKYCVALCAASCSLSNL